MKTRKKHYKFKKKCNAKLKLFLFIISIVICGAFAWLYLELSNQQPAQNWTETKSVVADGGNINLPKDDASHQEANTEWWSYHARLITESGKRFSIFYVTILTADSISQAVSHVILNDFQSGQHFTEQFRNEMNPGFGNENHFYFATADRIMQGGNGVDHLKIKTKEFGFDLNLSSSIYPVFHGKGGIVSMGAEHRSYYYSRPRLSITGSLSINKKSEMVTGVAWFDHQWGDFSIKQLKWDWFGLQLADGSNIMLYQFRDQNSKPFLANGSITRDGVTELLAMKDFKLIPGGKWQSPKTGTSFPLEWRLVIPDKKMIVTAHSMIKSNEFDASATIGSIYWAGALSVEGTHPGQGFMNLHGYVGSN